MIIVESLDQLWLEEQFDQLKTENHVRTKVIEFEYRLREILQHLLNSVKSSISDFFTLAISFHFVNDLLKGQYIDSQSFDSIYASERNSGIYYKRDSLLFCDIDEVKSKAIVFYAEKINLLEKLTRENGLPKQTSPIVILELIEAAKSDFYVKKTVNRKPGGSMSLIPSEMAKQIRCHHHSLDAVLVDHGVSCKNYKTYNIEQMREIFSNYHGRLISEDNIIADCITTYPFGVYLKSEKYYVKNAAFSIIPKICAVDDDIMNGNVSKTFQYPYEGLVRLVKDSEHPWLKRSVLKYLLCGGTIKILHPNKRERLQDNHPDKHAPPFLLLEPSFSEYILGQFKVIEIHSHQAEIEVSAKDLVFVQHEVDNFIKMKNERAEKTTLNTIIASVYQNTCISNFVTQISLKFVHSADEKLNDENLKNYETGKKVRNKLKKFSTEGGKAKKELSIQQWQPLLDTAYRKILEQPNKKWSASNLAKTIIKQYPQFKEGTLRRKLPKDKRIKPYLINHK